MSKDTVDEDVYTCYGWSGNFARGHGHKSKQGPGREVREEGKKQAGNFQVPTLSSFHSREEGRKRAGNERQRMG